MKFLATKGRLAKLLLELEQQLQSDPFWKAYIAEKISITETDTSLHVGVFQEPFLQWILEGKKTVESRFSVNRVAPFGEVREGDVVLLKVTGGPIVGICRTNATWSYRLDAKTLFQIKQQFSELIGATDDQFWVDRQSARFVTLMSIDKVRKVFPLKYAKSDKRGWVVEKPRFSQHALDL
ncbi:MAG: ASCH domain-containing protein [Burkholderiales bacterium]|nr:ASCH domain-containing protein [Burkholderiales bacterium]